MQNVWRRCDGCGSDGGQERHLRFARPRSRPALRFLQGIEGFSIGADDAIDRNTQAPLYFANTLDHFCVDKGWGWSGAIKLVVAQ